MYEITIQKHTLRFANLLLVLHNLFFSLLIKNMNDLFPYEGKMVTVTDDMCDFNGHMNVNYIKEVFEQAWEFANEEFGLNEEYLKSGFSSFTLEDNYRFQKEFLLGDKIFPRFRLFNVNEKLFHMIGALFDEDGIISATYETVEGHIDMNQRKIAPMDSERLAKVVAIKKEHDLTGPVPYDIRLKIKDL